MAWDLSCRDWRERLKDGRSLVPDLPLLDRARGDRAVAVFDRLRLADVPGTPTMAEAGGDWFRDIVRAIFGAFDPVTRARMIRELFLLVPKKNSKALALDTAVATPTGFSTIGDIQVGDMVLAADGTPTRVMCKSQVFNGRRCFEVEFSTGETVVCDAEHLWVTDAHTDRDRQPRSGRKAPCPTAKTTAQIAESLSVQSGRVRINNHRTALCGALELPEARLPIHPYVLGAWLGDGHTKAAQITASEEDAKHLVLQLQAIGQKATVRIRRPGIADISLAQAPGNGALPYRFYTEARKLGVLGRKHVPPMYLRASRQQRLALLQGLMDTDGSISAAGQAWFTTTSTALRDDVFELVASLGLKPSASEFRASLNGKDCGPCWRLQFWPFDGTRSRSRQIVAVREVASVATQCIGVLHGSHQFLVTRSLLPTHNTTNGALLMLTALLLNERPRAPFLLTAPVQRTADEAFSAIAGAIALDPVLEAKLHVRDHVKMIVHRETKARLEIATFDPAVMTGKKVVGALIDEQHVLGKMPRADKAMLQLRGGMQPFPEAFLAIITTQSDEAPAGVFRDDLAKARAVRDGRQVSPLLPVLYEFSEEVQRDPTQPWKNPELWPRVTPNAGRSISIERLAGDFTDEEAKGEAALRLWASQHLNIEIGMALHSDRWAGAECWEQQGTRLSLDDVLQRSEVVTVGIDGGGKDDMLALVVLGRERGTGNWLAWAHAWLHEKALALRKQEATRYQGFAEDGDLTIVTGSPHDVLQLAGIVSKVARSGLLPAEKGIGLDPEKTHKVVLEALLNEDIDECQPVAIPQSWRLIGAITVTERKLDECALWHSGSRLMAWCVGNAKVEPRGNAAVITKQASGSAKIDPLMALFDAVSIMSLNPAAARSWWEDAAA